MPYVVFVRMGRHDEFNADSIFLVFEVFLVISQIEASVRSGVFPLIEIDPCDGKPDLAVANFGSNTVSMLLNNGNGTFAPKIDFPTGSLPRSVASADLNGDGTPDLAVANQNSNTVSVLFNACAAQ